MEYAHTKYGEIRTRTIGRYIRKKKNDVYKLLPLREEGGYWKEHLETVCVELNGCYELFDGKIEGNEKVLDANLINIDSRDVGKAVVSSKNNISVVVASKKISTFRLFALVNGEKIEKSIRIVNPW